MAETPSFFRKIFKFRFWRHKKKKPSSPGAPDAPRPRSERSPDKPLKLAPSQRPSQPPPDPYAVSLPIDHALHQLWRLRRNQTGWLPSPELRLLDPNCDTQPVAPADALAETPKLIASLTASAGTRLVAATPVPSSEMEEPEPVHLNAQANLYVTADQLSAWLILYPPVGDGQELSAGELLSAIGAAGVTFGVDQDFVSTIPGLNDRYFHVFHIAQGQPAVPGTDGVVTDLFPREATRKFPVDEFNRVDFTASSSTQNVEKDQEICHIAPPTPGLPGRTVTDQAIPTRDGVPAVPPMGRNTLLNEDGSALIAGRAGGLEFSGRAFQVNPLLDIAGNVDYSTGNINFLGDVHVHGDVCSGFTVRAMGNIQVDGVVESCTIEAGGDVVLTKGVQGNNQAVIRAHRDVYAKFLENCSVHAKENLHSECIIGCEVYCDAAVYAQSGRGVIIGGKVRAAREVGANTVGSKTEVRTSIVLGGMPCEDFEKALLNEEIAQLELQLKELERQPESPTKLSRMSKVRMRVSVNKMKLNQYQKKQQEAEAELGNVEKLMAGRLSFGVAYPGTRVRINDARLKITQETRHSSAMLINGEVKLVS